MPHEPKKRHSRQRQGKRRASIKLDVVEMTICKNCQVKIPAHTVCRICGFYKGQMVIDKTKKEKQEKKEEKS